MREESGKCKNGWVFDLKVSEYCLSFTFSTSRGRLRGQPSGGVGTGAHAAGCGPKGGRWGLPEAKPVGRPPTGEPHLGQSSLPSPTPRPPRLRARRTKTQLPGCARSPTSLRSLLLGARRRAWRRGAGPAEGRRCWPAVTRRAHSQSAAGAGAGRPLNSARQLPAVWRVHSAMQYVCQRCGTKEQPFCDWAGPAPRCQGLTELLPALPIKLPFILAPENQKRGGWGVGG